MRRALDIDTKYYGDGENGVRMEQDLVALQKELGITLIVNKRLHEQGNPDRDDNNSHHHDQIIQGADHF